MTRRLALAALAGGLAVALAAMPAAAAEREDGLWYFDALNVQAAHDAGFTGEGVTIAVLDGQINPDAATLQGADVRVQDGPDCHVDGQPAPPVSTDPDSAKHATNVVSLIVGTGSDGNGGVSVKGVAPDATVLYYRISAGDEVGCEDAAGVNNREAAGEAIDAAVAAGADIITSSTDFSSEGNNLDAAIRALHEGVIFVTALSNLETVDDIGQWSSSINGGVSVQAMDRTGAIQTSSALGDPAPIRDGFTDVVAPGVDILFQTGDDWSTYALAKGTSFATPIVAGFLAVTSQKYPEATSNQLLQSLIHNTGVEDHELYFDSENYYGYGTASLTHLLRVDPTQYPDVNPLLLDDERFAPSPEQVAAGAYDVSSTPTPEPDPQAGEPREFPLAMLFVVLGVVVIVVVAVVVLAVLLARRRQRGNA